MRYHFANYHDEEQDYKDNLLRKRYRQEFEELYSKCSPSMQLALKYPKMSRTPDWWFNFHDAFILATTLDEVRNIFIMEVMAWAAGELIEEENRWDGFWFKRIFSFTGFDNNHSFVPKISSKEYFEIIDSEFHYNHYYKQYEFYLRSYGERHKAWLWWQPNEFKLTFTDMHIIKDKPIPDDYDRFANLLQKRKRVF
ncbi:MAG: hypothetical protein FWE37_01545 [Spirochaetaceae bacterium]|nr:hypothetical protein [Spirochaetaceae bacterium]